MRNSIISFRIVWGSNSWLLLERLVPVVKKQSGWFWFAIILEPMAQNRLIAFGDLRGIWRSIWGLLYLLGSQRKREWEVHPRDSKFLGFKLGIWVASSGLSTHISEGNPVGRVSHWVVFVLLLCWASWKQLKSFKAVIQTLLNGKLKIPVDFPEFYQSSEVCLSTTW